MKNLIEKYGSPLYIYDENVIINQINKLKNAVSYRNVLFCYAMKANSNLTLLETIKYQGLGIDCVSQGELILALKAGFSPSTIRFTPTFSSTEEISYAIAAGVQISIDNLQILEWLVEKHPEQPIGLRINPSVMAGAYEKTSVGHAKAKFGIGLEHLPYLEQLIINNGLKVNGLHIHSGSDILEISQFMEAVEVLLKVAPNFKNLEYIDLGSGFKVPYFDGDKETNIDAFGSLISARFIAFCSDYGKELKLIFEPGKYLVSEAGRFLVTCTGIKVNGGITFAGVDSGFNHLIRPMFYGAFHSIQNLTNPNGPLVSYDIVGNICETDTFASHRAVAEIRLGDILCFNNAGAYCYSMASSYNSRPRPAEVYLRSNGDDQIIRRRETIDDIIAFQVGLR